MTTLPICVGEKAQCFYWEMDNAEGAVNCTCTEDCEQIHFKSTRNSFAIDPDYYCDLYMSEVLQ